MDGMKNMVRKTPDSSNTIKLYRAISPSRKDQWSGNTLRARPRIPAASPTRWSNTSTVGSTALGSFTDSAVIVHAPNSSGQLLHQSHQQHRDNLHRRRRWATGAVPVSQDRTQPWRARSRRMWIGGRDIGGGGWCAHRALPGNPRAYKSWSRRGSRHKTNPPGLGGA